MAGHRVPISVDNQVSTQIQPDTSSVPSSSSGLPHDQRPRWIVPLPDLRSTSSAAPVEIGLTWSIFVRRIDKQQVDTLAREVEINVDELLSEFPERWRPTQSSELGEFLWTIRVLKVTRFVNSDDTDDKIRKSYQRVSEAIAILNEELPILVRGFTTGGLREFYTGEQISNFRGLAHFALKTDGVLHLPKTRHAGDWHQEAQLLEWHVRRLLMGAGMPQVSAKDEGPAVRVIKFSLGLAGIKHPTLASIGKALREAAKVTVALPEPWRLYALPSHVRVA